MVCHAFNILAEAGMGVIQVSRWREILVVLFGLQHRSGGCDSHIDCLLSFKTKFGNIAAGKSNCRWGGLYFSSYTRLKRKVKQKKVNITKKSKRKGLLLPKLLQLPKLPFFILEIFICKLFSV